MKNIAVNRKAYHEYFILEEYEAGIVLIGSEVKSIRAGKVTLKDAFVRIEKNAPYLYNVHISAYEYSRDKESYEPERTRKLLLSKREIKRLQGKVKEKGLTIIPTEIYFNDRGFAKIKIALVKGKKIYDKKEIIKKRDIEREMRKNN